MTLTLTFINVRLPNKKKICHVKAHSNFPQFCLFVFLELFQKHSRLENIFNHYKLFNILCVHMQLMWESTILLTEIKISFCNLWLEKQSLKRQNFNIAMTKTLLEVLTN